MKSVSQNNPGRHWRVYLRSCVGVLTFVSIAPLLCYAQDDMPRRQTDTLWVTHLDGPRDYTPAPQAPADEPPENLDPDYWRIFWHTGIGISPHEGLVMPMFGPGLAVNIRPWENEMYILHLGVSAWAHSAAEAAFGVYLSRNIHFVAGIASLRTPGKVSGSTIFGSGRAMNYAMFSMGFGLKGFVASVDVYYSLITYDFTYTRYYPPRGGRHTPVVLAFRLGHGW